MNSRMLCASLLGMAALWGCVEDDPGLRITIHSQGIEENVLNRLDLSIVASQIEPQPVEGEPYLFTCQTSTKISTNTNDENQFEFPYVITVRPGDINWECVAVQAVGYFDDEEIIRSEERFCPDIASEAHEVSLTLEASCLESDCSWRRVCRGGECVESNAADMFNNVPAIDQSCDSSSEE